MVTRDQVVGEAKKFLGMKWRHEGRGEGDPAGIDCVGLLYAVARDLELPCMDLRGYRREPDPDKFLSHIYKYTDAAINMANLHGAIGLFNDHAMPYHAGIFMVEDGETYVIHAESWPARRVIVEHFTDGSPPMSNRLTDVRLFQGVNYV